MVERFKKGFVGERLHRPGTRTINWHPFRAFTGEISPRDENRKPTQRVAAVARRCTRLSARERTEKSAPKLSLRVKNYQSPHDRSRINILAIIATTTTKKPFDQLAALGQTVEYQGQHTALCKRSAQRKWSQIRLNVNINHTRGGGNDGNHYQGNAIRACARAQAFDQIRPKRSYTFRPRRQSRPCFLSLVCAPLR